MSSSNGAKPRATDEKRRLQNREAQRNRRLRLRKQLEHYEQLLQKEDQPSNSNDNPPSCRDQIKPPHSWDSPGGLSTISSPVSSASLPDNPQTPPQYDNYSSQQDLTKGTTANSFYFENHNVFATFLDGRRKSHNADNSVARPRSLINVETPFDPLQTSSSEGFAGYILGPLNEPPTGVNLNGRIENSTIKSSTRASNERQMSTMRGSLPETCNGGGVLQTLEPAFCASNINARPNPPTTLTSSGTSSKRGWTALHHATSTRDINMISLLVQNGADMSACDEEEGNTSLHLAADAGDAEIAEYLCRVFGSPTITKPRSSQKRLHQWIDLGNLAGFTALQLAVRRGHAHVTKVLLEAGADVNLRMPVL